MIGKSSFQKIYGEIDKYLTGNWEKIIAYFEYGDASYSFCFYVKEAGKYTKCFDLPNVSDDTLAKSFKNIDKVLSKERKKEKDPWTNMTMIIEGNGDMHADLDYSDLSKGNYSFKKKWKAKYLV